MRVNVCMYVFMSMCACVHVNACACLNVHICVRTSLTRVQVRCLALDTSQHSDLIELLDIDGGWRGRVRVCVCMYVCMSE